MLAKEYAQAASLAFLIDRYAYLHGTSKDLLALVDHIKEKSPRVPIAPQLIVRKARLLKNEGDIQGLSFYIPFHNSAHSTAVSSIQPEAETLDFSTHALPRNLVKQSGNNIEGYRSQRLLFQPNRISAVQCNVFARLNLPFLGPI